MLRVSYRGAKRIVVAILGATLGLIGVAMLVLPGPGILVILLALSLLATEFVWARAWLRRVRVSSKHAARRARRSRFWPGGGPDARG